TPPTSPATCAVSRRPGRPWSAGAAAPPPRTSRRRRRTCPTCRYRGRAPAPGRDRPGRPPVTRPRARRAPAGGRPAPRARAPPPSAPPPPAGTCAAAPGSPPPAAGATPAETVTALRGQGLDLFTVTSPENPRAHRDSLGMAVQLQAQGGVETIVTMTTWD